VVLRLVGDITSTSILFCGKEWVWACMYIPTARSLPEWLVLLLLTNRILRCFWKVTGLRNFTWKIWGDWSAIQRFRLMSTLNTWKICAMISLYT
jgi:hypothetical protein